MLRFWSQHGNHVKPDLLQSDSYFYYKHIRCSHFTNDTMTISMKATSTDYQLRANDLTGFEPTKLCTETNHNVTELQHLVDFHCKLLATNEFSHYMEHNEHSLYHTHRCHASSTSVSYCHNVIHIIQKGFALANITSQQYSKCWFFRQTDWPNWHKPDNRSSVNTEMNRWFPIKHCKPRLWLSIERASVFLKMYLTIQSRPIP